MQWFQMYNDGSVRSLSVDPAFPTIVRNDHRQQVYLASQYSVVPQERRPDMWKKLALVHRELIAKDALVVNPIGLTYYVDHFNLTRDLFKTSLHERRYWMELDVNLLLACDAMVYYEYDSSLPESVGINEELSHAFRNNIIVYKVGM